MITLLLVDDEPMLLQSMVDNDWASIGIGAVRQAASGQEAAEVLKAHPVDIVVTDIRMPGMSGLELSKHIRAHYPHIKCILLSGYGEFSYAREAIEHGIVSYLLKPIQDEHLLAEVGRTSARIGEERKQAGSTNRAVQVLRSHLPKLRARLLAELLQGELHQLSGLQERLDEYELSFVQDAECALVMLRLEQMFRSDYAQDEVLFAYAVRNIACELLERGYMVWPGDIKRGYVCLLLQSRVHAAARTGGAEARLLPADDSPPAPVDAILLNQVLRELQQQVAALLNGRISALVQPCVNFPGELPARYRELVNEMRKIPRSEQSFVLVSGQFLPLVQPLHAMYTPPSLQQLLEGGRWQDARTKVDEILTEMASRNAETEESMRELYHTLRNALAYIAHLKGKTLPELVGWQSEVPESSPVFRRSELMRQWCADVLAGVEKAGTSEAPDPRRELLAKIHRFIESNISGDVSLQSIADHVDLHPVYLSSLYKQEAQENISDYIMRYRMEKAAMLLKSTNTRIYELAGMLGFVNPPYFSKLFKAYYKATPQEYRDRFYER
ncbi:hypothetical protein JCM10914A_21590 [Paenibacillus sp. JCM 10914]|uniref:response regulator transcription factor n=2 Tax=Bacillales TaxID=1385 RepID=UPI0003CCB902|nr:response regulator [Paenibacillus sp. JCM 10914]GAE08703.1 two-component response regulator TrxR [Paenibacillus sp. JCM 10914]